MLSSFRRLRTRPLVQLLSKQIATLTTAKAFEINRTHLTPSLTYKNQFLMSSQYQHHKNLFKSTYEGNGFHLEQIFTGCLAIYSYYIESGDDCFLIDPLSDIQEYTEIIAERKKNLKGIFITHYHADYVSGQNELQKKFGGKIYMGPNSISSETLHTMTDGEKIKLGNVTL